MYQELAICTPHPTRENTLRIIDERRFKTWLNEERMEVECKYNGKIYTVEGNLPFFYIVV
jgi:hypothetical protein